MFPSANPVKVECRDTNSQPMQPIGFGMFHVILAFWILCLKFNGGKQKRSPKSLSSFLTISCHRMAGVLFTIWLIVFDDSVLIFGCSYPFSWLISSGSKNPQCFFLLSYTFSVDVIHMFVETPNVCSIQTLGQLRMLSQRTTKDSLCSHAGARPGRSKVAWKSSNKWRFRARKIIKQMEVSIFFNGKNAEKNIC